MQTKRNCRILDGLLAINDFGQSFTLSDLAEHSLFNTHARQRP